MSPAAAERAARAALALAAAAALWALAGAAGRVDPRCPAPREVASRAGWTRDVACDGEAGAALRGPARLLFGQRLDLNCADPRALESLPGIGPVRAAAIAEARCERPFRGAADLTRVRGIGPRTAARLTPWVEVAHGAGAAGCRPACAGEGALP